MAKGDNKPRGRMSAYAYFVQTCREEHKKKHPNESVVFKDFTKKCADRWGTMSDKEKARFHDMAKKDKARYEAEMKNYVPPPGASKRRGKAKKDPNAPKRALSAFFMFSQDQRSKVRAAHPEWGVGDVARELGQQWAKMTSAAKVPYEKQAEKDKLRYEKEMANFRKGGGGAKPAKAPKVALPEDDDDEEEEDEEEEDDEEDDE